VSELTNVYGIRVHYSLPFRSLLNFQLQHRRNRIYLINRFECGKNATLSRVNWNLLVDGDTQKRDVLMVVKNSHLNLCLSISWRMKLSHMTSSWDRHLRYNSQQKPYINKNPHALVLPRGRHNGCTVDVVFRRHQHVLMLSNSCFRTVWGVVCSHAAVTTNFYGVYTSIKIFLVCSGFHFDNV
jgi:hypothetical protein